MKKFNIAVLRKGWGERDKWWENIRSRVFRKIDLKLIFSQMKRFVVPREGSLSWRRVFKIAFRNLLRGKSRTMVTVGGVTVGVLAIVLLVSFGYGLQEMVINKIIWPEALRIMEASSETTSVKIKKEMIEKIKQINGVIKVSPAMRLAGAITFDGSKIDTVVVGVDKDYLNMTNVKLLEGTEPGDDFNIPFIGDNSSLRDWIAGSENREASVAGVMTGEAVEVGDKIVELSSVWVKLRDDTYVPIYEKPKVTSSVVAYSKGSVLEKYEGEYYWGGVYNDLGGYGRNMTDSGKTMGKWLKVKVPRWVKTDGSYIEKYDDSGATEMIEGYITMIDASEMSEGELKIEKMFDEGGVVLGETDVASSSSVATQTEVTMVGTEAAQLVKMLADAEVVVNKEEEAPLLEVREEGKKEILVSQALVRAWNKEYKEVIGKEVDLQYLISGGLMDKAVGRAMSDKVKYKIIGVFEEKSKPMIYVPLGDVESMGVDNYSIIKVLVEKELDLGGVRSTVQSMGLSTRSVADTLSQINKLFTIVRFLLGSFGSIALMVALFGMFNTMTVSLLERTREIGVMKSLGTTNIDVLRIFLTEAAMISLAGAVLGVASGQFFGKVVDLLVFKFSDKGMFVLPPVFGLVVVLVVIFVGVVTGIYPSKRASKISALNALRYE